MFSLGNTHFFENAGGTAGPKMLIFHWFYKLFLKTGPSKFQKCIVFPQEIQGFWKPGLAWNGKRGKCERTIRGQQKGASVPKQCTRGDGK